MKKQIIEDQHFRGVLTPRNLKKFNRNYGNEEFMNEFLFKVTVVIFIV